MTKKPATVPIKIRPQSKFMIRSITPVKPITPVRKDKLLLR